MAPFLSVSGHIVAPVVALGVLRLIPTMIAAVIVAHRSRQRIVAGLVRVAAVPEVGALAVQAVGAAAVGMLAEAKACFEEVEALFPEYPPVLMNLGNIAIIEDRFEDAYSYYARAREQRSDDERILITLIDLNYRLGRFEHGEELYAELSKLKPELADEYRHLSSKRRYESRASGFGDPAKNLEWIVDE